MLRAFDRAGLRAGDALLVVGAGSNGLLAVAAARARGVEAVWVREPRDDRRLVAESLGAAPHADEPVDVAFVTTAERRGDRRRGGRAGHRRHALPVRDDRPRHAARPRHRAALPARADGLLELVRRPGGHARGLRAHRAPAAIDVLALVTHRLALEETGRALGLQRRGEALKAVVLP